MEELELLNKVKNQLMEKGELYCSTSRSYPQRNTLVINSDDWHEIFKTDEYNKMKDGNKL